MRIRWDFIRLHVANHSTLLSRNINIPTRFAGTPRSQETNMPRSYVPIRLRQPSRDFVTLLHLDRNLDTFLDAFAYVCPRMPCLCVCYMRKLSYVWDAFGSVPTHKLFVLLFHSYVLCTFCRDMRIRFSLVLRKCNRNPTQAP